MATPGTWNFLPFNYGAFDFGLTEKYAPWLGQNPNQAQPIGNTQKTQPVVDAYNKSQGNTLFNQKPPVSNATIGGNPPPQQTQQTQSPSGGGGGGNAPVNPNDYVFDPGLGMMRKIGDLQKEAQEREQRVRSGIETGYNQYESGLNNILQTFPQYQAADEQLVGDSYNSQLTGLQQGKTAANQKLDTSRTQVAERTKSTISDQAQNLRNILKASQTQLSAAGAGDSSATEKMLPYAYSKLGAREQGNIYKQSNQQYADIDKQSVDVESQYNSGVQQAEQWKSGQLMAVRDKYTPQITRIREMIATAPLQKQQALTSLESSLLSQARQELATIESQETSFRQQLTLNAQQQMQNLTAMKLSLDKSGSYNPQDIAYNQLSSLQNMGGARDNSNYVNYAQLMKKKQEEQGLSY